MKNSLKRTICILLAVAIAILTVGCAKKTVVKKIVKKKAAATDVQTDGDNTSSGDDIVSDGTEEPDDDNGETSNPGGYNPGPTTLRPRDIPTLKVKAEKYVEPVVPEFESKNVDWAGPADYTIVYDNTTAVNKVLAVKLAKFFEETDGVILETKADNDPTLDKNGKLILIGDTDIKKSTLTEKQFALTLLDNGNLFFEGGHTTMVEKAVDWFRTVDRVSGKVAVLTGEQADFVSKVNILGKEYVYVWGDEFDGEEFSDDSKWGQRSRSEYIDLKNVHNDPDFQYVENGKLRITSDRYFDPADGNIGWGTHGSCNSYGDMLFQNGYLEIKVRFDFGQGSFPALWLMTNDSPLEKYVPNYEQYKDRYFDLETDIFEFFGKGTHAAANMHKWYASQNPVAILDDEGNPTNKYRIFGLNGVELTEYYKFLGNTYSSQGRYTSFSWNWPTNVSIFNYSEEETKTLYKDYHLYQMLYEGDSVKFGIDNQWYCEWPLDVAFDYIDGVDPTNNNNGVGYNFWHYLFLDQYMYPPSRVEEKGGDAVATSESVPLNSYVDYVRLYQLPDQIAVITSAETGIYFD